MKLLMTLVISTMLVLHVAVMIMMMKVIEVMKKWDGNSCFNFLWFWDSIVLKIIGKWKRIHARLVPSKQKCNTERNKITEEAMALQTLRRKTKLTTSRLHNKFLALFYYSWYELQFFWLFWMDEINRTVAHLAKQCCLVLFSKIQRWHRPRFRFSW